MVVYNVSEKWSNGHARTLTGHHEFDPDDDKVESAAGDNRKVVIDGQGNCTISGDQVRIFCHYPNYNSVLTLSVIPHHVKKDDDCSLKTRSRHNEKEHGATNHIGGIGFATELEKWESKIEIVHGETEPKIASKELTKKMENGKKYRIRFTVKDEGTKNIRVKAEVDFGNGYEVQEDELYRGAPDTFFDKPLIEQLSYFWIRNNGAGSVTVSDVSLETLP